VKKKLAEELVESLSFRSDCDHTYLCREFSRRQWMHGLAWLDRAGLAFYFLQTLKRAEVAAKVPGWVRTRIERNLTANQERVAYMAGRFQTLNQAFRRAGVNYAVVKGFSLIPQFCPNVSLRSLSDLDYLVDRESLPLAQRVVEESGYSLRETTATESKFVGPSVGRPPRDQGQYSQLAPHAVELHLSLCDGDATGVFLPEPRFSMANVRNQESQGLLFPVLCEEDVFLLQAIHAFQHMTWWIRLSWFYEIGYFLKQRTSDALLWSRIDDRIGDNPVLREVVVLITELTALLFSAPVPPAITGWAEELRPAVRVWIDNYARTWAFAMTDDFGLFPATKLVLFLHQQYVSDTRRYMRKRLFPSSPLSRIARAIKNKPTAILDADWRRRQRVVRRTLFHTAAGLRYLWETPRWRRLNKTPISVFSE
jgi:hypothetical protein